MREPLNEKEIRMYTHSAFATFYNMLSDIHLQEYYGDKTRRMYNIRDDFWSEEITALKLRVINELIEKYGLKEKYKTEFIEEYGNFVVYIPKSEDRDDED